MSMEPLTTAQTEEQLDPVTGLAQHTGWQILVVMYDLKDSISMFTAGLMTLEETLQEMTEQLENINNYQQERRDAQQSGRVLPGGDSSDCVQQLQ